MLSESARIMLEEHNLTEVDLGLSAEDKACIERIKIICELPQFNFYGPATNTLTARLAGYLQATGMGTNRHADTAQIAAVVTRITRTLCATFDKESAWTMVRVSLPNNAFTIPRWHPDGSYFNTTEKQYKLVYTLKGVATLFGMAKNRVAFEALMASDPQQHDLAVRSRLDNEIVRISTRSVGYGMIFRVGDEAAVIHSEPDITKPRLFISVVPGSSTQIEEWRLRSQ